MVAPIEEIIIARHADLQYILWLHENASNVQEHPQNVQFVKSIIYLNAVLQEIANYTSDQCSDCMRNRRIAEHACAGIQLPRVQKIPIEQARLNELLVVLDEQQRFIRIKQLCYIHEVKGVFATGGHGLLVAKKIIEKFEAGDIDCQTMDLILTEIELLIAKTVAYTGKNKMAQEAPTCAWNFIFDLSFDSENFTDPIEDELTLEQVVTSWAEERGFEIKKYEDYYLTLSNPLYRPISEKAVQELKQVMKKWACEYNWLIEDSICAWPQCSVTDFEDIVTQGGPLFVGGIT